MGEQTAGAPLRLAPCSVARGGGELGVRGDTSNPVVAVARISGVRVAWELSLFLGIGLSLWTDL